MVLYYEPPELPFFNHNSGRRNEDSPSTSDEVDTGGGTLGGNIKSAHNRTGNNGYGGETAHNRTGHNGYGGEMTERR